MRFSVIVPFYNVEEFIEECLSSIENQSFRDFEVICIDDGSTDRSAEVVEKFKKRDPRFKLFKFQNAGVSTARNRGLNYATGEYIWFVDADDKVEADSLSILNARIVATRADIIVFGGMSFPSVSWIDSKLNTRDYIAANQASCVKCLMTEPGARPFMWNKAYKRTLLQNVTFNESLTIGEDQAFQFYTFTRASKIVFIKDKLYCYRQNRPGSAMLKANNDILNKTKGHICLAEDVVNFCLKEKALSCSDLSTWVLQLASYTFNGLREKEKIACAKQFKTILNRINSDFEEALEERLNVNSYMITKALEKYARAIEIYAELDNPKVSIIVPLYNAKKYIDQCLETLSKQTLTCFEAIFVDDGSTDGSFELVRSFCKTDPRFKIFRQEHKFAGVARNRGISEAKGEFLLFLDADDFFEPTLLEDSVSEIRQHDADICVFKARYWDQSRNEPIQAPWTCRKERFNGLDVCSRLTNPRRIFTFTTPAPWNKLFRTSFIRQYNIQYQNTRSANDLYFVFLSLCLAERICICDKTLLNYRVNHGNSLQQTQHKDPLAFWHAIKALEVGIKKYGIYTDVEPAFLNFCLDYCFYNLKTLQTYDSYETLYVELKQHIFPYLGLERLKAEDFYDYASPNFKWLCHLKKMDAKQFFWKHKKYFCFYKVTPFGFVNKLVWKIRLASK